MIPQLKEQPVPHWLESVTDPLGALPLKELLIGSLYYPACGVDGKPVEFLGGNIHSFVYADYGVGRQSAIEALTSFRGYSLLAMRDVTSMELTPSGWRPPPLPIDAMGPPEDLLHPPFALWAVFERNAEKRPEHGPARFSLLFIGGDGISTFQAIYSGNQVTPAAIAVIQPGTAFGGNWTDFCDPQGLLAQAVMENPAGVPDLLLAGGVGELAGYEKPCWPTYNTLVDEWTAIVPAWGSRDTRSHRLWCRGEGSAD